MVIKCFNMLNQNNISNLLLINLNKTLNVKEMNKMIYYR